MFSYVYPNYYENIVNKLEKKLKKLSVIYIKKGPKGPLNNLLK